MLQDSLGEKCRLRDQASEQMADPFTTEVFSTLFRAQTFFSPGTVPFTQDTVHTNQPLC